MNIVRVGLKPFRILRCRRGKIHHLTGIKTYRNRLLGDLECAGRAQRRRRFGLYKWLPRTESVGLTLPSTNCLREVLTFSLEALIRNSITFERLSACGFYIEAYFPSRKISVGDLKRGLCSRIPITLSDTLRLKVPIISQRCLAFYTRRQPSGSIRSIVQLAAKFGTTSGETRLTHPNSYLARLNYVHQNPVKHGLVRVANQYPWCSAGWFERTARPAQVKTIYGFKTDKLKVIDDYDVSLV